MRNPGEEEQNKGKRKPPLPPGGGAAGRAHQFNIERGVEEHGEVEREPDGAAQEGGTCEQEGGAQGESADERP